MENNPTENNPAKNNIFVYLMIVFLAIFFGTGIFLFLSNSKAKQNNETAVTSSIKEEKMEIPTEVPTQGSLTLSTTSTSVKLNYNFNVDVTANSDQKNIVGYDLVVNYDPATIEFINAQSLLPGFQIYTYKKENYVLITAVKGLQNQAQSAFSDNKILTLTFLSKKIGTGSLSLKSPSGNEKTKLVTDTTESLNPKLSDLQIEIN